MIDYIVVGLGLAGITFCETLARHGRSFAVVDDDSQQASKVAGGLYNPVVLKRFNPVWMAGEQLEFALPFYKELEDKLAVKLLYPSRIKRRFATIDEQNQWFEASDHPRLKNVLLQQLQANTNPKIAAPYGFGIVQQSGRLDTSLLIARYAELLRKQGQLIRESFFFDELQILAEGVQYKQLKARRIVFATGFGLVQNPYFNYLPIQGSKGEYVRIYCPDLQETEILKGAFFVLPEGNDEYLVGATYSWNDLENTPTAKARQELIEKLDRILNCDYKLIGQQAGIRPTVTDRKPLVGRHPVHNDLYVLNGFGSRGVMIGPWAADLLYRNIEAGDPLPAEIDLSRFKKKYFEAGQARRGS
ncbi:FAD-dependent oxidoreductase [Zeaxanthinibacter sp. PT1]|uniref:NAD(P)/FAD-dependent oxidoreductase n=1 Tax=Zeaxanthinibacter TaxID=561554 RepID=UPI00234A84F2|nr:FAD-dependent oxidoreductase [Zeaxanthinibacter sp. PT1]MDC6351258.1 FAD-dependent oxidoreductase [Zeaxanthinibacter sp. PT1]